MCVVTADIQRNCGDVHWAEQCHNNNIEVLCTQHYHTVVANYLLLFDVHTYT